MITIPASWQSWLRKQPEYGMGYQKGIAILSTGGQERGIILNGSIFAKADELRSLSVDEVSKVGTMVHESRLSIVRIDLIARSPESLRGVRRIQTLTAKSAQFSAANESVRASQGAKDAAITATVAGEFFKRFSPYVDDYKITEIGLFN